MDGEREEGEQIDQRLVRALGHPLRVKLLALLGEATGSPTELADCVAAPLSAVAYHTRVLDRCGCLELVETRPVRGSTEHFYRAKPDAFIGGREWRRVPRALRSGIAAESLQAFMSRAIAALEAGTFYKRTDSALNWMPMQLDEAGWQELAHIVDTMLELMERVGERSAKRLGSADGIATVVAVGAFEVAGRNRGNEENRS